LPWCTTLSPPATSLANVLPGRMTIRAASEGSFNPCNNREIAHV